MFISQIYYAGRKPIKCSPREFPQHVKACPPLSSFPGVIFRTSLIWEQVADMAQTIHVPRGEVIYPDPETIPPIIYVKTGKLCINYINEDGDERVLHYILPGATFYDAFYCTGGQVASMPVKAIQNCVLYMFDNRLTPDKLMEINPMLVRNLMYAQAVKNLAYSKLALINSYRTPVAKVAFLIYEMSQTWGRRNFPGLISQLEMANLLNLHKITVSNCISRLKSDGLIDSFAKSEVVISSPEHLAQFALCSLRKNRESD